MNIRPGQEAVAKILDQGKPGDGRRHLWLGTSGSGKSWANAMLLEQLAAEFIVVHDAKDKGAAYKGAKVLRTVAEVKAGLRGERELTRCVVVTHDTAERCAELVRRLGEERVFPGGVALVVDEMSEATSPGGREFAASKIEEEGGPGRLSSHTRWCLTGGRSCGVSFIGLAQSGKRCPTEAFNETRSTGVFRQKVKAVKYLAENMELDDDVLFNVVTKLPDYCFILSVGDEWDGNVYRFGAL
jgi:hypothetical protein